MASCEWDPRQLLTVSSQPKFTASPGRSCLQPSLGLPRPQMRSLNFSFSLLPFWTETENSFIATSLTHRSPLEVTGTHPTSVLLDVHQITSSLWLCLDYFCLRGLEVNGPVCYYSFTGPLNITPSENIRILHCSLTPIIIFAFHLAQREQDNFLQCCRVLFLRKLEGKPLPHACCLHRGLFVFVFLTNAETNLIL